MRCITLTSESKKACLAKFLLPLLPSGHCFHLRDFVPESCLIRVLPHFRAITHMQSVGNKFVNLRLMKTKAEKETVVCAVCLQIQLSLALHQFRTP